MKSFFSPPSPPAFSGLGNNARVHSDRGDDVQFADQSLPVPATEGSAPITLDGSVYRRHMEVNAMLDAYAPKVSLGAWHEVEAFVRDAAVLTARAGTYDTARLIVVAGRFVVWCTNEQGLPLEVDVIFAPRLIDAYCTQHTASSSTRATYRSLLVAISRTVLPAAHPIAMTPNKRRTIQPPYTSAEMSQYRVWATGQNTPLNREKAGVLLALTAGAGLAAPEIRMIATRDVTHDEGGVLIHVPGTNPRAVPMLRDWESVILRITASKDADAFLWGTGKRSASTDTNMLAHFAAICTGAAPSHPRLRATWITAHLALGTPIKELFRAGGMTRLTTLHEYLEFVEPTDAATHRVLLRGSHT